MAETRDELEARLKKWQAELDARTVQLNSLQKMIASVLKAKQLAQAGVERNKRRLAKIKQGPRRKAVALALTYVGITESPPNSNRGPQVDAFNQRFHTLGTPWCGAFVGSIIEMVGGIVTDRILYTPFIYEDANIGRNGLNTIVWKNGSGWFPGSKVAHSGDLVLYHFGSGIIKHVGMLVAPWDGTGPLQTVEGNTSFGTGSQDNGGCVARRSRDKSLVHSIVSVDWPKS